MCLRKISGVGTRLQRERSVSNDKVRAWLVGVPKVADQVRQVRLRWLGHVGRVPNLRLPKRVLFGVLPDGVGTPRRPGLQSGIRLRDAFAKDLEVSGIGRQGWLQFSVTRK